MVSIVPTQLRCNLLVDPLVVADERPRLSWVLEHAVAGAKNARQTAYRILVSSRERGEADLWDSGRVESTETFSIVYEGSALSPFQTAYWHVTVWDENAEKSEQSHTAQWTQAPDSWPAKWIRCDAPANLIRESEEFLPPPREFQKRLMIERPVNRAVLYATALGTHDFHINGRPAQDDWFAPGWTDYDRRVHYRAYEVTSLLHSGENGISAILYDGWYAGYVGFKPERHHYGEKTRISAFLRIEYEDGGQQTIATDESWSARLGSTKQSDFLMGEGYGSVEDDWHEAIVDDPDVRLEPYPMQPARTYAVLPAKRVHRNGNSTIYDLGQNFAGVCSLRLDHLEDGQCVELRHGEMLDAGGAVYTENLRSARATDTVIGEGGSIDCTPRGTFHGFRYVQLTGIENPPLSALTGLAISNNDEGTVQFECSDPRLNQLWDNIEWTQRSNFIEVPTDCPQRDERLGWTGDIQIYARTAALMGDVQLFLRKWLTDLNDAQREDGQYPMVAPLKVAGDDGGPAWSEAGVIVPWALYQVYEDKEVLERQWDSMERFMSFCELRSPDGLAPEEYHCFGDWLNVGADTSNEVIFTAYFAQSADLMAKIARVIGKEASHYETLFAKACETFAREYVAEDGTSQGDTQTGYVLALAFGLLDEQLRKKTAEKLVENIERHGHLTTGFVGTKDLMLVLRDIGRTDLAYKLLLSDEYPGWLFSVKHGATTIWERWNGWTPEDGFADPAMNSFSHYAYGAVGQFMIETIAGIRPLEPGYKKILIAPEPGPLASCRTAYDSVRGRIRVDWRIDEGEFKLEVSVPPNTSAIVRLPRGEEKTVGSGEWHFKDS